MEDFIESRNPFLHFSLCFVPQLFNPSDLYSKVIFLKSATSDPELFR